MTFITKFCILISLFLLPSYSFSQSNETVRFDGFYQTVGEIDSIEKDTIYGYLRFYPDGKVLSVSSTGNANDLKRWFNLKHANVSRGIYEINEKRIYFTTTSEAGSVVYDGKIEDLYHLDLSTKSLINGYEGHEKYYFIRVIGLKE